MKKENLVKPGVRYPLGKFQNQVIIILDQILVFCIGFTFSFPCKQEGLASARLTSWTKGFTCSGVVNEDVVEMLQKAIDEKVCLS
jgi:hexokinase